MLKVQNERVTTLFFARSLAIHWIINLPVNMICPNSPNIIQRNSVVPSMLPKDAHILLAPNLVMYGTLSQPSNNNGIHQADKDAIHHPILRSAKLPLSVLDRHFHYGKAIHPCQRRHESVE